MDLQVAVRLAFAIEGEASPAACVVQSYIAGRDAAMRARVARRWRAFRKCHPFFAR